MPKGIFGNRGKPALCHPERKNVANGLCSKCAAKKYYDLNYKEQPLRARKQKNLSRYGITYEDYLTLLEQQNYCCAICGSSSPRQGKAMFFHVDHNHNTGEVRGLLCGPCNRGIGYLSDNPELLLKGYNYLIRDIKLQS